MRTTRLPTRQSIGAFVRAQRKWVMLFIAVFIVLVAFEIIVRSIQPDTVEVIGFGFSGSVMYDKTIHDPAFAQQEYAATTEQWAQLNTRGQAINCKPSFVPATSHAFTLRFSWHGVTTAIATYHPYSDTLGDSLFDCGEATDWYLNSGGITIPVPYWGNHAKLPDLQPHYN